jgi:hypothetical protein
MKFDYIEKRIPGWALPYLVNADNSGISPTEEQVIEKWLVSLYPDIRAMDGDTFGIVFEVGEDQFEGIDDMTKGFSSYYEVKLFFPIIEK